MSLIRGQGTFLVKITRTNIYCNLSNTRNAKSFSVKALYCKSSTTKSLQALLPIAMPNQHHMCLHTYPTENMEEQVITSKPKWAEFFIYKYKVPQNR